MTKKILFIVAHPDDESLWVGGTLNFLSKISNIEPYVLCLTGRNHPERSTEIKNALSVAGIKDYFIGTENIPTAHGQPLQHMSDCIDDAINFFGISPDMQILPQDIDLVVTHPYYGDEHKHPQHIQVFKYVKEWCQKLHIPFAFFSTLNIPFLKHTGKQQDIRRNDYTHIISYGDCEHTDIKHFVQIKADCSKKYKMLQCYPSINIEQHHSGYASWDSCVEHIYFCDNKGFSIFEDIINNLESPAGKEWYK